MLFFRRLFLYKQNFDPIQGTLCDLLRAGSFQYMYDMVTKVAAGFVLILFLERL